MVEWSLVDMCRLCRHVVVMFQRCSTSVGLGAESPVVGRHSSSSMNPAALLRKAGDSDGGCVHSMVAIASRGTPTACRNGQNTLTTGQIFLLQDWIDHASGAGRRMGYVVCSSLQRCLQLVCGLR